MMILDGYIALLIATVVTYGSHGLKLETPDNAPSHASGVINPSFVSFAIQCLDFPDYTNEFSRKIFGAFSSRLHNHPLIVRLGGTAQ